MKRLICLVLFSIVLVSRTTAKPPPAAPKTPPVSASQTPSPSAPWLRWLLEQDGGATAITAPVLEVLQAISGQPITTLKSTDPVDAGVTARIGNALDGLLPRLNRPDSAIRLASRAELVAPLVEQELQACLVALPGTECVPTTAGEESLPDGARPASYPSLRLTDSASHRVYYLGVAFVPAGQNDAVAPILQLDPIFTAKQLTVAGTPLLIVLECNGKTGKEFAFLNWQLVDLQAARARLKVSFSATQRELALPASVINDGRKGRD